MTMAEEQDLLIFPCFTLLESTIILYFAEHGTMFVRLNQVNFLGDPVLMLHMV